VFVIETDAFGAGIRVALMKVGHLLSISVLRHQSLSTYERELMVVMMAMEIWRPYLLGRHFIIRTYHFSLKYIMEKKITTLFQTKWLPKLMGFDYEIIYKHRKSNMV